MTFVFSKPSPKYRTWLPSGARSTAAGRPSKTAEDGQVSRHWAVRLAIALATPSTEKEKARIEAPGRPSGVSSGGTHPSTPISASQPRTLVP